jgi:Fe(3+) dicitrate transport protein
MRMKKTLAMTGLILTALSMAGQTRPAADTMIATDTAGGRPHVKYLAEITLVGRNTRADIHFLPEVVGTTVNAGKKNALIVMDNVQGNVVNNTMRQVMAKVPGIQVWESDPSGIQIGIAARGLSPNRSWEFNVRQNGYDISSDPFGYPEAYYTPQLNSVQRIQVVRGSASLQYGPQFGGLVNFILKDGSEATRPLQYETQQTLGSFGLFNTYHAVGGRTERSNYYAFWDHRRGDGFRPGSGYGVHTGFATYTWKAGPRLKVGLELTQFDYRSRQPGGLTDAQFAADRFQSLRSRNHFGVKWSMAAVNIDHAFSTSARLNVKLFGMDGQRNSVGHMATPDLRDSIHPLTLTPTTRRVDLDRYRNAGAEARFLTDYAIGERRHTLTTGVRAYLGHTLRRQNGRGDAGDDFDLGVSAPFPTSLDFHTFNAAAFAENIFRLGADLLVIPGIRYEHLSNTSSGRLATTGALEVGTPTETRNRNILLAGVGAEYHVATTELYASISQAYRPVLFGELVGNPTTDVIDARLRDANGHNIDLGWRGRIRDWLFFDVSVFSMAYRDRVGLLAQQRADGSFYNLRTNVGDSRSRGTELLVEFSPVKAWMPKSAKGNLTLFLSSALIDARYGKVRVVARSGNNLVETNLSGRRVENAPAAIHRAGLTLSRGRLTATLQYGHVSRSYSDANNTRLPAPSGVNGPIPAYDIVDVGGSYRLNASIHLKAGINNLLDVTYFTRRSGGYPGPGILPAEPRNMFVTAAVKL